MLKILKISAKKFKSRVKKAITKYYKKNLGYSSKAPSYVKRDYKKAVSSKYLNKADDTNTFGIVNSLTRLMQQDWFKDFRTDTKYDHAWIEKFVSALLASEHQQELLAIWQDADKRLTLKGNIIGCLNKAGIIDGSDLSIAAAIMQGQEKDNKTFASYMGRGRKRPFFDWICGYVNQ